MLPVAEPVIRRLIGRALGAVYTTIGLLLLLLWACGKSPACTIAVLLVLAAAVILYDYVFRPLVNLPRLYPHPGPPILLGVAASALGLTALLSSIAELLGLAPGPAAVYGLTATAITLLALLLELTRRQGVLGPPELVVAATLATAITAHWLWPDILLPATGLGMTLAGTLALWSHYLRGTPRRPGEEDEA